MKKFLLGFSIIAIAISTASFARADAPARQPEKLPAGMKIVAVEAQPSAVELRHRFDYRQMLLTGRLESGERIDVTRMAQAEAAANVASVSPTGVVRPLADGSGQIKFNVAGQSIVVPVSVAGFGAEYKLSFVGDVMPTLSKLGCNAGTCHGSLNGKNGFKLSLRGYDPLEDFRALTDDVAGRRINRAAPDQSLMLLKPSGVIPHVGGALTHSGEPYYELLRLWIASGVKLDLNSPKVTKIELLPKDPVVPLIGMSQQMTVMATYSDGRMRDVTLEAFINSGNTEVAESDKLGLMSAVRRGEAPILARFEGNYTVSTLTVMGDRGGFAWNDPPAFNYIDELVYAKLKRVKTLPSDLCTDADYIRRVYLDLTGLPPSADDVRIFLADARDTKVKRDELVDRLIGNGDYVEHWTNKWADLLQVNRKFLGEEGAFALRGWIKQAVATNMPYDKFVYSILTASGSTLENPPAAYFKILRAPEEAMENTTQLFLAVRFNCNKCHDHPFERWTQGQYYHLAAYFSQVGRKEDPASKNRKVEGTAVDKPTALIEDIYDTGSGDVKHLGTGKVAEPTFPYQHKDVAPTAAARREQLARWIASKENQYFAKSYVNRLWGYLFGLGIIEPIDDIRAGNPPSNPELLERLAKEFITGGFNAQELLRTICKSRTYQLSIVTNKWNAGDDINFAHAIARRLPAETLYDTLSRATGSVSRLPGVPAGYRAAQLPDVGATLPSGFFEVFGRPARESACECERTSGMMLGPVMSLVNGPTIADAIADPNNAITKLVKEQPDDAKVIDTIFLRVLNRPATPAEIAEGTKALHSSKNERDKLVADVEAYEKQLDAKQAAWEADLSAQRWQVLDPTSLKSSYNATLAKQPDQSVLVSGPLGRDEYTITAATDMESITGLRLEVLTDPSLPANGPGRAPNGNFVLSALRMTAAPKSDPSKAAPVTFSLGMADFNQDDFSVGAALDGVGKRGWAIDPQEGKNHVAAFQIKDDLKFPGGTQLVITLDHKYEDSMHTIGKFRLSVTQARRPIALEKSTGELAVILEVPADKRTPEQQDMLRNRHRAMDPEWVARRQRLDASSNLSGNERLVGAQDLVWALVNSPAFLFNR